MEPSELRLIVNGHMLATERVHRPDNDFSVSVALYEPLDFVEVWSGETDRLLLLPAISQPPAGEFEQAATVDLIGRKLQLNLRFTEPWPTLAVRYQSRVQENAASNVDPVFNRPILLCRPSFLRFSIPAFSTIVALALIVVMLFVQTRQTTLDAAELLNRAEEWQENITTQGAPVLHRRFSLVKQNRGTALQRTFVDVWRRAGGSIKLSRWTDASGRILAEVRLGPSALPRLDAKTIWQFEPSADAFAVAAGPPDHATVSTADGRATIRTGSAELVLDGATNRPVEEKLSADTSDYVFRESSTETLSLAASPFSALAMGKLEKAKRPRIPRQPAPAEVPYASLDSNSEERELRVRRELHRLELAATATVQSHGGTIDVQLAPTSGEQVRQLQALETIPDVQISLLDPQAAVRNAATIENSSGPTLAVQKLREPPATKWLKALLTAESSGIHAEEERRVESARHLVDLVAEWRLLAERYPIAVETRLSAEARSILDEIVDDLRKRIRRDVNTERAAVKKLQGNGTELLGSGHSEHPCQTWQAQAGEAADLLWENDQAIEQFYSPVPAMTQTSGADALAKLRGLMDAVDIALQSSCANQ